MQSTNQLGSFNGREKWQEVLNGSPCQVGNRTEVLQQNGSRILVFNDQPQVLNRVQRFRSTVDEPVLHRGTMRRGSERGVILEFAQFDDERKNMLLHIFRLEAKAPPKRPAKKGGKSPESFRGSRI
jgi:hypothetical protein